MSILSDKFGIAAARAFIYKVIAVLWQETCLQISPNSSLPLPKMFPESGRLPSLNVEDIQLAMQIGEEMAKLSIIDASYQIGEIYTRRLPNSYRAQYGIYFTPPALTNRLLNQIETHDFDWKNVKVIDPACGGGAFLSPVALRMKQAMKLAGMSDKAIVQAISSQLSGMEIDPFSAWMSQVFFEMALLPEAVASRQSVPFIVEVNDTLRGENTRHFDLVIGNPPYSKINLDDDMRKQYARSLYGHANLYGLFTHRALMMLNSGGLLAFVTPTSFLSGKYFKKLREVLSTETDLLAVDFIEARKGVFADVLQETVLAIFKRDKVVGRTANSNTITVQKDDTYLVTENGNFTVESNCHNPWLIPRNQEQTRLLSHAQYNHATLREYGYTVSTGPLVWNRHKDQLSKLKREHCLPLIWPESVLPDGNFLHRPRKKYHAPWFEIRHGRDDHLIMSDSCLVLLRTSAKEQRARLNCTIISRDFIEEHGGVVIENHLNVIKPIPGVKQIVGLEVLKHILRSCPVDDLFRVMSGSVAVSAYELEALFLPPVDKIKKIADVLRNPLRDSNFDRSVAEAYL